MATINIYVFDHTSDIFSKLYHIQQTQCITVFHIVLSGINAAQLLFAKCQTILPIIKIHQNRFFNGCF